MPSLFLFSTSHANKTYRFFFAGKKKKTKASLMRIAFAWSNNTRNKGQSNRKKNNFFQLLPFFANIFGNMFTPKKNFSCKHTIRKLFPIWVQKKSFDFISGKQKSLTQVKAVFFAFFLVCFFFIVSHPFRKKGKPQKKKTSKN